MVTAHIKHQITVDEYPEIVVTLEFKYGMNTALIVICIQIISVFIDHTYTAIRLKLKGHLILCTKSEVMLLFISFIYIIEREIAGS